MRHGNPYGYHRYTRTLGLRWSCALKKCGSSRVTEMMWQEEPAGRCRRSGALMKVVEGNSRLAVVLKSILPWSGRQWHGLSNAIVFCNHSAWPHRISAYASARAGREMTSLRLCPPSPSATCFSGARGLSASAYRAVHHIALIGKPQPQRICCVI